MSELLHRVVDSYSRHPRVALLMSGYGSNAEAILSDEEIRDLYDIGVIVTDNPTSRAAHLAEKYTSPLHIAPSGSLRSPEVRSRYFDELAEELRAREIGAAVYAGFMKISTASFCQEFPGVNTHPADLTITGDDGLPVFRGMRALSMMRTEVGEVRSSVHIVDTPVDSGSTISLSESVVPDLDEDDDRLHERLKTREHRSFPLTLRLLAKGRLQIDSMPYSFDVMTRMDHE